MAHALREAGFLALAAAILAGCPAKKGCPPGQADCGLGICADLSTDASHCGGCWVACGSGTCAGGVCQCEGLTRCDALNPRCRNLDTDASSCGSCGNACPLTNAECVLGNCQCPMSFSTECPPASPTACVNLVTDRANCGACGQACTLTNEICSGSACRCPDSLPTACPAASPTACVNLATDAANCGSCGLACPTGDACCSNACKDLASDEQNCGSCGHACPAGGTCCSGSCKDLTSDEQNCGTCGRACPTGATCTASNCVCPDAAPVQCGSNCCAGNGCCGTGQCQTEHTNGIGIAELGQHFYDCNPLGTYSASTALEAAEAWGVASTNQFTGFQMGCVINECLGWQTTNACAVWCFGNPLGGRVSLNTIGCICPTAGTANWN